MNRHKTTILDIQRKKDHGEPISVVTAYDYSSATLADTAELDILLVGDSLGMVMLGYDNTAPVTMDEMVHHCRAVARGARHAFLVGDMPFMSYEASTAEAIHNAGRLMKKGRMDAVKLEGGTRMVPAIRAITRSGIAVMGHIGLTPQSQSQLGGFRVQGKTADNALKLVDDALALEDAGCFAIVLEAVPARVAAEITARVTIPTIGIGAGADCDGQVLVYHDLLGLFDQFTPRFVKQYANLREIIVEALASYRAEVSARQFPAPEHTYPMADGEEAAFLARLNQGEESG